MKIIALLVLCAGLASCATEARFKEMLDTWRGHTEQELVQQFGVPDKIMASGDSKFLEYHRTGQQYIPGVPASYSTTYVGNTAYTTQTGGSPGSYYRTWCQITFTLMKNHLGQDIVISWSYRGNHCIY